MNTPTLPLDRHPCFNHAMRRQTTRIHLPVAPRCNVQCNFCNRKTDCVNESRPGVTSVVLTPRQALAYVAEMKASHPNLAVAGIAGPGDPMANPNETLTTLRLVREQFPELLLCVATNGLELAPHVAELARLKVSHVTITINAVEPAIAAKVYAWGRINKRVLRGAALGELIVQRQIEALRLLKEHGVVAKVNSIILPGVNDDHINDIARTVAEYGADIMNCIPLLPAADTPFGDLKQPDAMTVTRIRLRAGLHLPQMTHCARCRADAAGFIGEENSTETTALLVQFAAPPARDPKRKYIAVASQEGVLVNQHLGEAKRFLVFEINPEAPGGFRNIGIRPAPESGKGEDRWRELAQKLGDCRAVLVAAAGPTPRRVLEECGLLVVPTEGLIEENLAAVFAGKPVTSTRSRHCDQCGESESCRCGSGTACKRAGATCQGTGTGCG